MISGDRRRLLMSTWKTMLRIWLPLMVAIMLLSGLSYVIAQQLLRQSANDPQIQIAEDAAADLESGAAPAQVVGSRTVEMSESLAPYLIVYDAGGKVLASSARLHDAQPLIPQGVLDAARSRGQNRVTWQPETNVRSATVIGAYGGPDGGTVLAGRSLREVEVREDNVFQLAFAGGLATAIAVTLVCAAAGFALR
jgi:hypothetical protein